MTYEDVKRIRGNPTLNDVDNAELPGFEMGCW